MQSRIARWAFGAGLALAASVGVAQAAVCEIPRALLCEGCASQISVTVARGGRCRVTFTPGGTAQSLRLEVLGAPRARVAAWRPRQAPHVRRFSPGPRCFMAGGRNYCE